MVTFHWILPWIISVCLLQAWEAEANGLRKLHSRCQDGYFGYKCRFRCRCKRNEVCDKVHGSCIGGCRDGFWGPGCQLSNSCFYNGEKRNYMGTKSTTSSRHTCQRWEVQIPQKHTYTQRDFPERVFPQNFCRTTADSSQPWCYTLEPRVRWEYCSINNCNCPPGRFGSNCGKECHCSDQSEGCDSILGMCKSGCASGWTGYDCQTPVPCPANKYGWDCSKSCHCRNTKDCDRFTGPKSTCKCKKGYFNPPLCEPVTAPRILDFGNTIVNPGQPSVFNCTVAAFPTPYESEIQLRGPNSKRISLVESKVLDQYLYTRTNLFSVNYVVNGERYTCSVKATAGTTSLTIVAEVFELPRLNREPRVKEGTLTATNITLEWNKWNRQKGDTGDGPILWYSLYVKAKKEAGYRMVGIVYHTFCEDTCSFMVPELTPNTEYAVYIVTRRDGDGGDGPPGPLIHVKTDCAASTPPATSGPTAPSVGTQERNDLDCSAGRMHIHVPQTLLPTHAVTLRDPSCKVTSNGSHLLADVGVNECGTTVSFTNDSVIFTNELVATALAATAAPSIIDYGMNTNDQRVKVSCIYPRESRVDFSYVPVMKNAHFYEKQYGKLSFEVNQYSDEQFSHVMPHNGLPMSVTLNTEVFIDISLQHASHKGVGIRVDSCIATPTSSPADPLWYPLIKDECSTQQDVRTFTSPVVDEFRFSFLVFRFTNASLQKAGPNLPPNSMVFLHCQVSACPTDNCTNSCSGGISNRIRRDAEDDSSYLVSAGPFFLKSEEERSGYTGGVVAASVSMAVVATLVAIVALVAWRRSVNKLSKHRIPDQAY